jgi:hypothetical protein
VELVVEFLDRLVIIDFARIFPSFFSLCKIENRLCLLFGKFFASPEIPSKFS